MFGWIEMRMKKVPHVWMSREERVEINKLYEKC